MLDELRVEINAVGDFYGQCGGGGVQGDSENFIEVLSKLKVKVIEIAFIHYISGVMHCQKKSCHDSS